jgi:hypothetical protein
MSPLYRVVVRVAMLLLSSLLLFGPLSASSVSAAQGITVALKANATLLEEGQAVQVRVRATCPTGYTVLEAFVYIGQEGNESDFAFIPLACQDKQKPRDFVIRVPMFPDNPPFHPGDATATAFVLIEDPATGDTLSGGDNRAIRIK